MRTELTLCEWRGPTDNLPRSKHSARITQHSVLCFVLCALLSALCSSAHAQKPGKIYRIGLLLPWSPDSEVSLSFLKAFREGLQELGYVENRDLAIEHRYGEGVIERLPDLAAELVRLQVDLIVTSAGPPALAAKQATKTIPIVFTQVADPVAEGLIASLARRGEISRVHRKRVRRWLENGWSC